MTDVVDLVSRTLDGNGVRLHVEVRGAGNEQSLLFLSGLTNSTVYWRWITEPLAERYRVVSLDLRGHGASDRAQRYATPDFVDDAIATCEEVAGAGSVVVAHSFGGLIGAALAQQRPDLVRAVFLEDPLLVDPGVRTDLLGDVDGAYSREVFAGSGDHLAMLASWQQEGMSVEEAASDLASMPSPFGTPWSEVYFEDSLRALADGKLHVDLRILDDFAEARESRDAAPVFDPDRPIDVPGLLLAADPSVPGVRTRPLDIARLRATSPRVRDRTVAGAGHFMHDERHSRAAFTDALEGFLADLA